MNSQQKPVERRALFASISLFALGCVFGGVLHSFWTSKAAVSVEREPVSAISPTQWGTLNASLTRIGAQLASAQRSAPGERVEVGTPPTPSIDTLTQTVRELQASIDQLRVVAAEAARAVPDVATPHELDQVAREVNWPAVDALAALEAQEEGAALRGVRFSTPNEILRRFGPPDHAYGNENGTVTWDYSRTIGNRGHLTYLNFAQGGVVSVVIRR